MTVFTQTWDASFEAQPPDTQNASQGALRIRNTRIATRERLEVDHSWAGDANDGAHKQVTLLEAAADPTFAASTGFSYTKAASGITELFYMDSAGTITQMTINGKLGDASTLGGQAGSYYQNANNMNAGTLPVARLSGTYTINITGNVTGNVTGNADTATLATNAGNLTGLTTSIATLNQFAGNTYKPSIKDHGTQPGNYNIDLSLADMHVVAFSAAATLTISSSWATDRSLVVVKNGGFAIALAGIDAGAPTLTTAVSTQDLLGISKSFGKIICNSSNLNEVAL